MTLVPHLDDARCFDVALQGLERPDLLEHLETCPDCGRRTSKLAGDVERQLLRAVGSGPLPSWLTAALEQDLHELPIEDRTSGVVSLAERRDAKLKEASPPVVALAGGAAPDEPRIRAGRRLLLDAVVLAAAAGVCFLLGAYWREPAPIAINQQPAPRAVDDNPDVRTRAGDRALTGDVYCMVDGSESAVVGEESRCAAGAPLHASAKRPGASWRFLAFVVCDPNDCRLVPEGESDEKSRAEFPMAAREPTGVWVGFFVGSNTKLTEPALARAVSDARAQKAWPPSALVFPFETGSRALRWTLVKNDQTP